MVSVTCMFWIQISLGLWICCQSGVLSNEDKSRRKVIDKLLKNPSKDASGLDEVENDWVKKEERARAKKDKRLEKKLESEDNDVPDIGEKIQNSFGGKYYVIAIIGIVVFLAVSCTLHALLIKLLIDKYKDSEDKGDKNKKKLTRQEKRQLSRIFSRGSAQKNKVQESTVPLLSRGSPTTRSPKKPSERPAQHIRPQGQKIAPRKVISASSGNPKREVNHKQIQRYDDRINTPTKSKEYNSSEVHKNKNYSNIQSKPVLYSSRKTDINSSKQKKLSHKDFSLDVNTIEQATPIHFQNSRGTDRSNQGNRFVGNTKSSKEGYQHTFRQHRSSLSPLSYQNTNTVSLENLLYEDKESIPRGNSLSPLPQVTHCPVGFRGQLQKLPESRIQNTCSIKHSLAHSASRSALSAPENEERDYVHSLFTPEKDNAKNREHLHNINQIKTRTYSNACRQVQFENTNVSTIGDEYMIAGKDEIPQRSKISKIKSIQIRPITSPQRYKLQPNVQIDKQLLLNSDQEQKQEPLPPL